MNAISERWQRLEALFDEALAVDTARRGDWLAALDVDDDVKRELAGMLDADAQAQAQSPSGSLTQRFGAAIASAAEVPVPGERIGAFRLLREIGSGGVGVVFLAERADDQFHQEVAIKVIRGVATGDAVRQLRHERQILAGFEHPNIARLIDGGATPGGHPYLVIEFIRGEPITDACRKRRLTLRQRLALVAEVARAVHYAHQRLVVHRDIKPANVLLREDGRPVLLDFGIAKLIDERQQRERLATQPWFTPAYAAPEQRRGGTVSTATDVYALGLLLFELITDERPILDVEQQLLAPSLAAPEALRPTIRGDLDRIVALATQDEPGDRYPSADALARDLDRYLAGQPVRAAPDSATYKLRKFVQRHRYTVATTLLALVLLSTAVSWLVVERDRALAAEARAARQSAAADAVTSFLVELFREADPSAGGARVLTPVGLVDRGYARMQGRDDLTAPQRARLAGVLGQIYMFLGEPGKATEALDLAIAAARAAHAPPRELVALLSDLGTAHGDRGNHGESRTRYAEGLALARESGDREAEAKLLAALGSTEVRAGETARGEALLREAIALDLELHGADAIETAKAESYLAEALVAAGRREEAAATMDRAIATMRRRLPPHDYQLLRAYSRYGSILIALGRAKEAEPVVLELLKQRERIVDRDSSLVANAYLALGAVYHEQGRAREAAEQMAKAVAIGERTLEPDDPNLAQMRNGLGVARVESGDPGGGAALIRQALDTLERKPEGRALSIVRYRQNLGRAYLLAGDAPRARRYLEIPVPDGAETGYALNRALQRVHLADWHLRHGSTVEARRWLDQAELAVADLGGREGARYAQVLKLRAQLALRERKPDEAQALLEQARALLVALRGERLAAVGEIDTELAALAQRRGAHDEAVAIAARARSTLEATLVADAPQLERLAAVERALAR